MDTNTKIPGFIIAGAPKCGTTTLHEILSLHPQIFLPDIKEVHFFDNSENYAKGIEWYSKHYTEAKEGQILGDITPAYMFYDYAPERIKEVCGNDVKIIFILRNPVDRGFSEYLHNYRRGLLEEDTFLQASDLEFKRPYLSLFERRHFSFISRGFYSVYLKRFLDVFPKENFLFLHFEEDFVNKTDACIKKIQEFLQVDFVPLDSKVKKNEAFNPKSRMLNVLIDKPSITKKIMRTLIPSFELRKRTKSLIRNLNISKQPLPTRLDQPTKSKLLHKYFMSDIEKTEILIGRDLSKWKQTE